MSEPNEPEGATTTGQTVREPRSNSDDIDSRPGLMTDRSFWGMITTQFLGAFNDNLYKQLMLLLAAPVVLAAAVATVDVVAAEEQGSQADIQGWATVVFSLPFVLFSGLAGYLSDRFSKTPIIRLCKLAEIAVMLLGLLAFYYFDVLGTAGTWIVLFLMGTQSAFFGPGKYGILPELFRARDLPRANGIMLLTTFLAIIFGTVLAGVLKDVLLGEQGAGEQASASNLWLGMVVCIAIAVVGTITSLFVRRVRPAQPEAQLTADCFAVSKDVHRFLNLDRGLLVALLVSSVFWLVSGLAVPTVNRLGRWLEANDTMTSILTASIGFGIMTGAMLASFLCRKGFGDRCVTLGLSGIFASLVALGAWSGEQHVLGYSGSMIALISLGIFAAIFAIPIQVFIQDRPPSKLKGRMIATMNQANFIGILISGPLYQLFEYVSDTMGWPISSVFWMMSLLVLPLAIYYRLDSTIPKHEDIDAAPMQAAV